MSAPAYRDAWSAWQAFKEIGGLDLKDRDADLEPAILARLGQPWARHLEDALIVASPDDLVRAVFGAITPFVELFRATLEFFKVAGATEGREQWSIKIDEDHVGLEDFEQFLSTISEIPRAFEVPDIVGDNPFDVLGELRAGKAWPGLDTQTGDPEVDAWLSAYQAGAFPDLPRRLAAVKLPAPLAGLRTYLSARLAIARTAIGDRATLRTSAWRDWSRVESDPYDPHNILQAETDYWAQMMVLHLHQVLSAGSEEISQAAERLRNTFDVPRRSLEYVAESEQLERILSLPVWRRRHELYAVWVATEIVNALPDHEVLLHHEDGKIVFAFKETEVARIATARPVRRLVSERRTALESPVGAGRTSSTQPDYGIWSICAAGERCHLIIEVKHYKRARTKTFQEVLIDYANAHPTADVILVNHGPISWRTTEGLDRYLSRRCHVIGDLTTRNPEQRKTLAGYVQNAVGPSYPMPKQINEGSSCAMLVDISGSMRPTLRPETLQNLIANGNACSVAHVSLVDVDLVETLALEELADINLSRFSSRLTNLGPAALDLLRGHESLLVFTDSEGLEQLSSSPFTARVSEQWGETCLALVSLEQTDT